jgi:alkanesulfonate monooxygenase SsuD/methylene tetrahydromethanopterin reductase-like flavin-dependent oxidoreductase (luciferase family)
MKFGIFDHVDRQDDRPLAQEFDERLEYVKAADEAGFYGYHIAEHHATPLNMVPVPGVYLGAVARATKKIRLGPLVYLLPLYSPLRLIEEIAMLDHLSHGRLDVGVGRGVSPFELNFHKVKAEDSRDIFIDAYDALLAGLSNEKLTYKGKYFNYENVPLELHPLQKPYPPFWYGSSNETGSRWAGDRGLHFVTLGSMKLAKANITAFQDSLTKRGGPVSPKPEFKGGVVIGASRQIIVAETDAEAEKIARPARDQHHASLTKLQRENVGGPLYTSSIPQTYEDAVKGGAIIVGSPATVRAEIERQAAELGINYMISAHYFGNMKLEQALRSLKLFSTEIMPKLERL